MIKKLLQAAILVAGGLTLGGCPFQQQAQTAAPANKPAAADYQAPVPAAPAAGQIRAHVHGTYPLEQAAEALALIAERKVQGKVVLVP